MDNRKMKKKIRPRHSEKSNTNIRILARETAEKIKGIDNVIPPIPLIDPRTNTYKPEYQHGPLSDDEPSILRTPLFSNGLWDCACALSFCFGFVSLGIFIGVNLK